MRIASIYAALCVLLISGSPLRAEQLACSSPSVVALVKEKAAKLFKFAYEAAEDKRLGPTASISLLNYLPTRSDDNSRDCTATIQLTFVDHTVSDQIAYLAGKTEDGNFVVQTDDFGSWARRAYEQLCIEAGVRPKSMIERLQEEAGRKQREFLNKQTYAADPNWSQFPGR